MKLKYSWLDLLTYPLMLVLLSPLLWHLGKIVAYFVADTR